MSRLEDKSVGIIESEEQKEKRILKNKQSLKDLCNITKCTNICITAVLAEKMQQEIEIFEEIMAENFPNLMETISLYIQKVQQIPSRNNSKSFTLRHIIIKLFKTKDKENIKAAIE